jgi:hypothetical protein
MHCASPGLQEVHWPRLQTGTHTEPLFAHLPSDPQTCGWFTSHCVSPGVQTPVQALSRQT